VIDFDTTPRQMLVEHVGGDSFRKIGQRHKVSHEYARQLVIREGTRFVDGIELDLMVAAKLEKMGREATWPAMAVPFQEQGDWQRALAVFQWVVNRLRARDVDVQVLTRPTSAGTVFMLTLGGAS